MRASRSGISLSQADVRIALGMEARGDRKHDIAAWFGVNQGRIAEAKAGEFGTIEAAPEAELPPAGPPGLKGRRLFARVEVAIKALHGASPDVAKTQQILQDAVKAYNTKE